MVLFGGLVPVVIVRRRVLFVLLVLGRVLLIATVTARGQRWLVNLRFVGLGDGQVAG